MDIDNGPSGGRCRDSLLACFTCPNALVLEHHLPALLALADTLQADLQQRDAEEWATRHGATWQVLTRDILPRFSPAQRAAAAAARPVLPLNLIDGPKEQP
ncbi:hypothetical protein [Streptomyces sp. NPDC057582]|uniref:hypothetical protein n=1 Tax=Streptomyces sp. NPDC057582 TaxID=3346174 RepID=UPI003684C64B